MRKLVVLVFVLFSLGAAATAQIPTSGNIYAGYSYYNTNLGATRQGLSGWEGSIEGKFFPIPFLGIFADFSANYGDLKFPSPAGLCAIGVAISGSLLLVVSVIYSGAIVPILTGACALAIFGLWFVIPSMGDQPDDY